MRRGNGSELGSNSLLRTQGMGADSRDVHTDAWVVWGSIFVVFLLALLPWRLTPWAPDLLVLVIAFWVVHEGGKVGLLTGFILGLLIDAHDAGPLGQHALTYVLVCYGAVVLRRRLLRFNLWRQAMHMMPIFVLSWSVTQMLTAWLMGTWPGWSWLASAVLTSVLWVPIGWMLLLPGNRLAAMNSQID
jgi:rod shape-determining protein MreD